MQGEINLRMYIKMSDNSRAMLEAWKRMDKEDRDALWMMMAMMDRESIRTTMYLNQERMQYSLGKTEKALQFASQHYYGNYSNNDKDHNLCFIVTNNSLAETEQWKVRVGKKFGSLNIFCIFTISITKSNLSVKCLIIIMAASWQPC